VVPLPLRVCAGCGICQKVIRSAITVPCRAKRHSMQGMYARLPVTQCPACGWHPAQIAVAALLWTQPVVQRFLDAHPRSITEPEILVEY
jgi:hypothetical protein